MTRPNPCDRILRSGQSGVGGVEQAKEYEARAEMAERQAARARDAVERQAFLDIAHLWRKLSKERVRMIADPDDGSD